MSNVFVNSFLRLSVISEIMGIGGRPAPTQHGAGRQRRVLQREKRQSHSTHQEIELMSLQDNHFWEDRACAFLQTYSDQQKIK